MIVAVSVEIGIARLKLPLVDSGPDSSRFRWDWPWSRPPRAPQSPWHPSCWPANTYVEIKLKSRYNTMKPEPMFTVKTWMCETEEKGLNGSRSFWSSGHSDHALARGFWRFASPRLRLGIVSSLLSDSIVSQHIVWLVYTVRWEQWISSTVGSIRSDTRLWISMSGYRSLWPLYVQSSVHCTYSFLRRKCKYKNWRFLYQRMP